MSCANDLSNYKIGVFRDLVKVVPLGSVPVFMGEPETCVVTPYSRPIHKLLFDFSLSYLTLPVSPSFQLFASCGER